MKVGELCADLDFDACLDFALGCANRVLDIWEQGHPGDTTMRASLAAARTDPDPDAFATLVAASERYGTSPDDLHVEAAGQCIAGALSLAAITGPEARKVHAPYRTEGAATSARRAGDDPSIQWRHLAELLGIEPPARGAWATIAPDWVRDRRELDATALRLTVEPVEEEARVQ